MGFQLSRSQNANTDSQQPVSVTGPGDIFSGTSEGTNAIRVQTTGAAGNSLVLYGSLDNINFIKIQEIDGPGTFLSSILGFRYIKLTVTNFVSPFSVFWNDEEHEVPDQDNAAEYEAGIRPPRFDRAVIERDISSKSFAYVNYYDKNVLIKRLELAYDIDGDLIEVKTV